MIYTARYVTRRGGSAVRTFDSIGAVEDFIRTLRRPCVVEDEQGREVAWVERDDYGVSDDRRVKWAWWMDMTEEETRCR